MDTLSPKMVTTLAGEQNKKMVSSCAYLTRLTTLSDDLVKSALKLKKYKGVKYHTVAENISGLIPPGSTGVNHGKCIELSFINPMRHFCSSGLLIGIPTDGVVILLTVTIVK